MTTTLVVPEVAHESAADARCGGCDQPAHDVGWLTTYRVGFSNGTHADVRYCGECTFLAKLSITYPGDAYGALALSTDIVSLAPVRHYFSERDLVTARALGQRFALALRLNHRGAAHAYEESAHPHRDGDETVVYSVADTEAEARDEFADWGDVLEIAALVDVATVVDARGAR